MRLMTLALFLAMAVVSLHAQTTSPAAIHVLASHEVQIGAAKARYELTALPHTITRRLGAGQWESAGMLLELRAYMPGTDGTENEGKLLWRKFEPEWDKRYGRWTGDFSTDPVSSQTIIVYSRGHLFSAFAIDGQYRPTSVEREAKLGGDLSPWEPMQTEWGQYVGIPRWMSEYVSSPGRIRVERATDTLLVNMSGAGTAQMRLSLKDLRWRAPGTTTRPARRDGERGFFSTDDGRTWFADAGDNIPPVEINGRTAVRAFVFVPPNNPNERFVGYLMQYDKQAKDALQRAKDERRSLTDEEQQVVSRGMLVKRPCDQKWVPLSAKPEITSIRTAGGEAAPVLP